MAPTRVDVSAFRLSFSSPDHTCAHATFVCTMIDNWLSRVMQLYMTLKCINISIFISILSFFWFTCDNIISSIPIKYDY